MNAIRDPRAPRPQDPMDPSFCMMLHSDQDEGRSVLEVRRTLSGMIFFQCAHCKNLPRSERAPCSTVAPQSVEGIYRGMVRFNMNHVAACSHIPRYIRSMMPNVRSRADRAGIRGVKSRALYLTESARDMGLANDRGRIITRF